MGPPPLLSIARRAAWIVRTGDEKSKSDWDAIARGSSIGVGIPVARHVRRIVRLDVLPEPFKAAFVSPR